MIIQQLQCEPNKWIFWCPGCHSHHWFDVTRWTWNGSLDKPTVRASILNNHTIKLQTSVLSNPTELQTRCHIFITDGQIQYLEDCTHSYAGETVPMEHLSWTI